MKRASLALGICLAVVSVARAAGPTTGSETSPDKVVYDARDAYQFLMTMAGEWTRGGADHDHGSPSRKVDFKVSAAGSSVVETLYPGQPNEMITMFHWNGDDLMLTHYCALQNAPVMKFQKSDKPGEIKFVFHGGTNFDPQTDLHVHEGVYQVKDNNTVDATFTSYEGTKPKAPGKSTLKRKITQESVVK